MSNHLTQALERRGIRKEAGSLKQFFMDLFSGGKKTLQEAKKGYDHGTYVRKNPGTSAAPLHAPSKAATVGEFVGKRHPAVQLGGTVIGTYGGYKLIPGVEPVVDTTKDIALAAGKKLMPGSGDKKVGKKKEGGENVPPPESEDPEGEWIPGIDNTITAGAGGGIGGGVGGYLLAKKMGWDPLTGTLVGGLGTATAAAMLASWMKEEGKKPPRENV